MTYRLPSNLESFVPPPAAQTSAPTSALTHPWRGTFIVSGMRASDKSSNQEIRVTAVETDGDNRVHTWPTHMVFSLTSPYALPIMSQVQSYIRQNRSSPIPLCTILPDRLRDPNTNAVNLSNFRNLSRILYENEMVALASLSSASTPESPQAPPSSGILIFPASNSTALLVGALFLDGESFPDFVLSAMRNSRSDVSPSSTSPSIPISPSVIQARSQHRQYHQSEQRDMMSSGPFRPHEHMSSSTYPSTAMRYQHRLSSTRRCNKVTPLSGLPLANTAICLTRHYPPFLTTILATHPLIDMATLFPGRHPLRWTQGLALYHGW
ncbi:hypothetical protein ARMGADRAFT_69656 [Armillaria gallica]|uniref:Uncharacterized protein n=1 Tax=Armillaria gallica TaxID=47427 RepID=A0A2H3DVK9_ARMGA|nr:hypothetical protein ARMGADRAFT_69656 [Armillaria gallica]